MKAAVYAPTHGNKLLDRLVSGLQLHGVKVTRFQRTINVADFDFVAVWGWRKGKQFAGSGKPILVAERGYIGDRFYWTSLGWNGLNGLAKWNIAFDGGERFDKNYSSLLKPWERKDGYALLIGQVANDMSLARVNINNWYTETKTRLEDAGYEVVFRQHPVAKQRGHKPFMVSREGSLEDAFKGAAIVTTYNSNTAVDSVLAGIPSLSFDRGSMAYDVTGHRIVDVKRPDRTSWIRDLSWRQWSPFELQNGEAWAYVKTAMP